MRWSKLKKILICMMAVLLVSAVFCNVYADINESYYNDNLGSFKVSDTKENLVKKTKTSILLEAIGSLVYVLASLGEWLLGIIFQAAAGGDEANNIFPWADAIVFNAIPFLDVNFLNPYSSGTVVELIGNVIKSIYGTIFGLAISFFSIAVLIMGVKLAISTIASEKAKYKQAVVDWLVGLVLLFTIHIFISFVFYLNEQLVNKASTIATNSFNDSNAQQIIASLNENVNSDTAIKNFIEAMGSFHLTDLTSLGLSRLIDGIDSSNMPDLETSKQILEANSELAIAILTDDRFLGDSASWYVTDSDNFFTWKKRR